jgi:hypothetical protein
MGGGCYIGVADAYNGHLSSGMPLKASYLTDVLPIHTDMEKFYVRFESIHPT